MILEQLILVHGGSVSLFFMMIEAIKEEENGKFLDDIY